MRATRIVAEHYGLELREGDAINLRLPTMSEIDRDIAFGDPLGWEWTYWPDGTKTLDFPRGSVRLPAA